MLNPKKDHRMPDADDAAHCAEVPFIFGKCFPLDQVEFNDTDKIKSEELTSYLTNFCKKGNPNSTGLCPWLPADQCHPQRDLIINKETKMRDVFKDGRPMISLSHK